MTALLDRFGWILQIPIGILAWRVLEAETGLATWQNAFLAFLASFAGVWVIAQLVGLLPFTIRR